jgi:hypothetical protein
MKRKEDLDEGCLTAHYRLRVQRIEEERPADLDWRSDVLYTEPRAYPSETKKYYHIHLIVDGVHVKDIAYISDRSEAKKKYYEVKNDLKKLSKPEFDAKYGMNEGLQEIDMEAVLVAKKDLDKAFDEAMMFVGEKRVHVDNK